MDAPRPEVTRLDESHTHRLTRRATDLSRWRLVHEVRPQRIAGLPALRTAEHDFARSARNGWRQAHLGCFSRNSSRRERGHRGFRKHPRCIPTPLNPDARHLIEQLVIDADFRPLCELILHLRTPDVRRLGVWHGADCIAIHARRLRRCADRFRAEVSRDGGLRSAQRRRAPHVGLIGGGAVGRTVAFDSAAHAVERCQECRIGKTGQESREAHLREREDEFWGADPETARRDLALKSRDVRCIE